MGRADVVTETVWEIEPHTKAKHEILTRYLDAWFPILASWSERVLFIDGFAGPGSYRSGEPGSPRLALESAKGQARFLRNSNVMFLFNEADPSRFQLLEEWRTEENGSIPSNFSVHTRNQQFVDLAGEIVERRGDKRLVPTFAFVDPFGFKGVPLALICDLVRDKRSELFILFSFNSVNRWITHEGQQGNLSELFGCSDYAQADGLGPDERKRFLADLYERQLREVGQFPYVSRFEMIEMRGRTSYFLYHCTRSLKGLEVMRSAMWKIDPTNGSQFSDRVAGIEPLFDATFTLDLDKLLITRFKGQTVPIKVLQDFVLTDTRYAPAHLKKDTLKPMQERGLIECIGQKRKGTYPEGVSIHFL
ncbi:three-Cys-motif partner protein TcmP [Rhodococcus koreensis]